MRCTQGNQKNKSPNFDLSWAYTHIILVVCTTMCVCVFLLLVLNVLLWWWVWNCGFGFIALFPVWFRASSRHTAHYSLCHKYAKQKCRRPTVVLYNAFVLLGKCWSTQDSININMTVVYSCVVWPTSDVCRHYAFWCSSYLPPPLTADERIHSNSSASAIRHVNWLNYDTQYTISCSITDYRTGGCIWCRLTFGNIWLGCDTCVCASDSASNRSYRGIFIVLDKVNSVCRACNCAQKKWHTKWKVKSCMCPNCYISRAMINNNPKCNDFGFKRINIIKSGIYCISLYWCCVLFVEYVQPVYIYAKVASVCRPMTGRCYLEDFIWIIYFNVNNISFNDNDTKSNKCTNNHVHR